MTDWSGWYIHQLWQNSDILVLKLNSNTMTTINQIVEQFNTLKHPPMNAPHDDCLSDIRQSFELDIDSIAGFLSYEASGKKSPYTEQVLKSSEIFKKAMADVIGYSSLDNDNINYRNEVVDFLAELIIISEKLTQYISNRKNKD